jgi:hypothetical protein
MNKPELLKLVSVETIRQTARTAIGPARHGPFPTRRRSSVCPALPLFVSSDSRALCPSRSASAQQAHRSSRKARLPSRGCGREKTKPRLRIVSTVRRHGRPSRAWNHPPENQTPRLVASATNGRSYCRREQHDCGHDIMQAIAENVKRRLLDYYASLIEIGRKRFQRNKHELSAIPAIVRAGRVGARTRQMWIGTIARGVPARRRTRAACVLRLTGPHAPGSPARGRALDRRCWACAQLQPWS